MILVGNGRVITRDAENPYLEDGYVTISTESASADVVFVNASAKWGNG